MKREIICGIYKITSPTGRVYIGQGVNILKRFSEYKTLSVKTKNQTKLWRSFLKHGVENHQFDIIEYCDLEDLNCSERFWQDEFDVLNGGLNCILTECGDLPRIMSEDTKNLLRIINTGNKHTELSKIKIGLSSLGNSHNIGRIRPESEKLQISNTMKEKGIASKERNNMWGKHGADNPNSKLIVDLNTGIFYYGVKEASFALGIKYGTLKKCICNNRINHTSLRYC